MKAIHVVALTILVSVVCSALTAMLISSSSPGSEVQAVLEPGADYGDALAEIRREQERLSAALDQLRSSPRGSNGGGSRSPVEGGPDALTLEAVRELVDQGLAELANGAAPEDVDRGRVALAMQNLLDPNLSDADRQLVWDQVIEDGLIDAVVAEFERRAEEQAGSSVAQLEVGVAYHQKMRSVGVGVEAGKWGQRGSEAYERALALDEMNWDARYYQAQHYFFAGMKGDSFRHFEILREQQKIRPAEDKHSKAFLFLGNMYMDQGKQDEAKKVWAEGLSLFPGDSGLLERLSAFE